MATVHGSELNFSVKPDPRLVPYTADGLDEAAAVVTVSEASAQDVVAWAAGHGLQIGDKTCTVPPGVDASTFVPAASRAAAIAALRREVPLPSGFELRPEDDILASAGRLLWTKGVQHAVSALPPEEIARLVVGTLERYPTADPAFRSGLHELSGKHFPSWEKVARRYLELATQRPGQAQHSASP